MKNKSEPLKPVKNKQKTIALILGSALALCSILAPFSAYTVNADVIESGDVLVNYAPQDFYHHPLSGFSLSCCVFDGDRQIEVFDCPDTYGGNGTFFSNRDDFMFYRVWQNTENGTFSVESFDDINIYVDDTIFQFVGLNVALVREHIDTIGWTIGTGDMRYYVDVFGTPILSINDDEGELIHYRYFPSYWYDGQYKFYWADMFRDMPDYIYADNGTALFDMIWFSFTPAEDYETVTPSLIFADEGTNTDISISSYAGRVTTLYNWIYNGSPIETILSFPIDFLKTEIFPRFSFGTLLLIALGVLFFGFALKIALGG